MSTNKMSNCTLNLQDDMFLDISHEFRTALMQETNMSNNEMSTSIKEQSQLTPDAFHMFSTTMMQLIKQFEQMRKNLLDATRENCLFHIEIAKHAKQDITSLHMNLDI